jgi:predicted nucleic acid-binding protein
VKTRVSSKGQLVIPLEIREQDQIEAGQEFDLERLDRSAIIIGEIRFGILLLPRGKRRSRLERWFDEGVGRLKCLAWDAAAGLRWPSLGGALGRPARDGSRRSLEDSLIAATALLHGLTAVTPQHE